MNINVRTESNFENVDVKWRCWSKLLMRTTFIESHPTVKLRSRRKAFKSLANFAPTFITEFFHFLYGKTYEQQQTPSLSVVWKVIVFLVLLSLCKHHSCATNVYYLLLRVFLVAICQWGINNDMKCCRTSFIYLWL